MRFLSWLSGNKIKKINKPRACTIRAFSISGQMTGSSEGIVQNLSSLSFARIKTDQDTIVLEVVESEDYEKNPYLFIKLIMSSEKIEVKYSIPQEEDEQCRMLEACKLLFSVLMLTHAYAINAESLFAVVHSTLQNATELLDTNVLALKSRSRALELENRNIVKKVNELLLLNEKAGKTAMECSKMEQMLNEKIASLEQLSDHALNQEICSWLSLHSGKINANEFAKLYNVPVKRIENSLDFLLKHGYIARADADGK